MSERYYVRIRGRVHGPMPLTKLQTLAARGQLSRIHEVSMDGQTWQPAAKMPELFTSSHATTAIASQPGTDPRSTTTQATPAGQQPATAAEKPATNLDPWTAANPNGVDSALVDNGADPAETWYYAVDSTQQGPIPRAELVNLIRAGTLTDQDMVWKSDMENWTEAGSVTNLQPLFAQVKKAQNTGSQVAQNETTITDPASDSNDATALDTAILRRLVSCRQWVHWSTMGAFVLCLLFALNGALSILSAFLNSDISNLALGIPQLVCSGLFAWLGSKLSNVNASIQVAETTMASTGIIDAVGSLPSAFRSLAWLFLIMIGMLALALIASLALVILNKDRIDGFVS